MGELYTKHLYSCHYSLPVTFYYFALSHICPQIHPSIHRPHGNLIFWCVLKEVADISTYPPKYFTVIFWVKYTYKNTHKS